VGRVHSTHTYEICLGTQLGERTASPGVTCAVHPHSTPPHEQQHRQRGILLPKLGRIALVHRHNPIGERHGVVERQVGGYGTGGASELVRPAQRTSQLHHHAHVRTLDPWRCVRGPHGALNDAHRGMLGAHN